MFNGKKVIVTGHTGFKGSWLTVWLDMLGARVAGYGLDPEYENSVFPVAGVEKLLYADIRADIRNRVEVNRLFGEFEPDIVFHLAAQPLVIEGYRNPADTFEVNLMGTVNVLEAIRECPSVKSAVIVTTDKCYENMEWPWGYRETDSLGGRDPYSASKSAAELAVKSYRNSFFSQRNDLQVATVRAGNVIGGGDRSAYRIVPDIIKAVEAGREPEIRMPFAVRPWQHVLDPLWGYLTLAKKMIIGTGRYDEPWNFGPGTDNQITVEQLAEELLEEYGGGKWKDCSESREHSETGILALDTGKARTRLGWQQVYGFKDAVSATASWYRASVTGIDMMKFTRSQITEFMKRCNSENVILTEQ